MLTFREWKDELELMVTKKTKAEENVLRNRGSREVSKVK